MADTGGVPADARATDLALLRSRAIQWGRAAFAFSRYMFRSTVRNAVATLFNLVLGPVQVVFLPLSPAFAAFPERLASLPAAMAFWALLNTTLVSSGMVVIAWREARLLRRFRASPLPESALLAGVVGGNAAVAGLAALLVYLVAWITAGHPPPANPLAAAAVWAVALYTMTALGLLLSRFLSRPQSAIAVLLPFLFFHMGMSGVYDVPFPPEVEWLTFVSPARPAFDWFRAVALDQPLPYAWEPWLVLIWCAGLGWLAARWFRWE